uniref:helix-turn-helix transcriptional regulator n=1 Tax=Dysosmobacter welbionis TaxID=2093857 RepID=UPI003079180C
MDMSKAIREGRDRLGMSQEALAERLGVSRQAVSKWEMGTSVPSPENRRALSEILGTDLQVERETAPPVPLRRWKRLTLAAGQEIAKSDFGWYLFPPDSTVNVAVTFQDGREHTVDQVVLFLYPTGTGVAEERQQIGVRRIRDGRTFALFRWQIPASLYSHLEVQLECGDGQTISVSQWNVIDRDSAF